MFVPIVVGSAKTTASIGTGNVDFWPMYGGVGNKKNGARRSHGDGIALLAFLAIPKSTLFFHLVDECNEFCKFRYQLFHSSIRRVFDSVRPYMTTPRVTHCADQYFRRAIYGFGPDIADYPEQALLTGIVQGYCPICLSPADDLDRDIVVS
ncbi:hypothetical protein MIND_00648800 [Mycena indigotica]|uniref:Uncharacterized protein n=1 Tax=Mycena indigotica TaxID=2126181 RepID=A0A8H6SQW2_9AGAR|nr:uncharacterized protein MIND_00648800 [Mycena indigotica]KAF7304168.1 hypothetical protein MIND_00648800 [Mycena indigotica]